MPRYIIVGERFTTVESNSLTDYLAKSGLKFWHWVEEFWLVIIPPETMLTPEEALAFGSEAEVVEKLEAFERDISRREEELPPQTSLPPKETEAMPSEISERFARVVEHVAALGKRLERTSAKAVWDKIVSEIPSIERKTMLVMRIDPPISYWGRATDEAWNWFEANGIKNW